MQHSHVPNSADLAAPQHARHPRGPGSLCTSCRLHHSTQLLYRCCVRATPNDATTFKNYVLCTSLNPADILRKKMRTVFFTLFCTLTLPDAQPVDTEIVQTDWMANPKNKLTMHCLYLFSPLMLYVLPAMLLQHSRVCYHPQATCPHLKTETFLVLIMSYLQRELLMNGYTLDLPRCFHLRQKVLPVKMRSWIKHLLLLSSFLQLLPSSEWEHN